MVCGCALPLGQRFCPWGFGFAPRAKGLPQGQRDCPMEQRGCPTGKRVAPGGEGLPQGQRGFPWGRGVAPQQGIYTQNLAPSPKMVLGHNLQHMAPFGIPTSGFCMVFQDGSLIFSTPGPIWGPQDPDLGSGWAEDLFWSKQGPEKYDIVVEMVSHGV